MKYQVKHSIDGRIRFQLGKQSLTSSEEDILEQYLLAKEGVERVKVYRRTASVAIWYSNAKSEILAYMKEY
ncbi:MAG: heavy metal translocating P-type ATPase, partial [Firmicutes bacterium]|nr:heavy metal translocating P-type ATPase [Candidatus Scybalomonas excrementavium]